MLYRPSIDFRRFFLTKPATRSRAKIENGPPLTAGSPVKLPDGCTFIDLKFKSQSIFPSSSLPPSLPTRVGQVLSRSQIEEMKSLRLSDPEKWSITKLAKKFGVCRLFVINKALKTWEIERTKKEVDERIKSLSTKQQKGWVMRHKIRNERENSW